MNPFAGNGGKFMAIPVLNRLEEQARASSPRVQAAAARVAQARAVLGFNQAGAYPTLDFSPDASRYRVSGNRPDQPEKVPGNHEYTTNRFRLPLYASYEIDFWGKYSRLEESASRRMEASVAAYYGVLLTLQSDLAQTYFQLRAADEELVLLARALNCGSARAIWLLRANAVVWQANSTLRAWKPSLPSRRPTHRPRCAAEMICSMRWRSWRAHAGPVELDVQAVCAATAGDSGWHAGRLARAPA
jgi:hypothetical protein